MSGLSVGEHGGVDAGNGSAATGSRCVVRASMACSTPPPAAAVIRLSTQMRLAQEHHSTDSHVLRLFTHCSCTALHINAAHQCCCVGTVLVQATCPQISSAEGLANLWRFHGVPTCVSKVQLHEDNTMLRRELPGAVEPHTRNVRG